MPPTAHTRTRRNTLRAAVDRPIVLLGNGELPRTLPMTPHPFRQDSTFLYLTGCRIPGAALVLDGDQEVLYLPTPSDDDPLWHGPLPTPAEQGQALGFDEVRPLDALEAHVQALGDFATLAVADPLATARLSGWRGVPLGFGSQHGDADLVQAIIAMRRVKGPEELAELRIAAMVSARAHIAVMRAVRPGTTERALTALFEGVLACEGATPGYQTILTVRGEVLHNHHHGNTLAEGQLLLIDGGGEIGSGYTADITRTIPVSGTFTPRQRAAYDAVLEAERTSISLCRVGTRYRDIHDASSRVLARFLADEGLITCSPDAAVESGAHALFFPHGVGHHLGMDVHDLENFGDLPAYAPGAKRSTQFGTCNLRLDLPLEKGWVVTIEPGFYVVPAILHDPVLQERFAKQVDFAEAHSWIGFGGIRIEDDVAVTAEVPEILSADVPRSPEDIEALVNTGPSAEQRLC